MTARRPTLAVDCIIEQPGDRIVLIRRKQPPLGYALPATEVREGESLHEAAVRAVQQNTGLSFDVTEQFFAYSDPKRDPRGHTVSVVYVGWSEGTPTPGDEAIEARAFPTAAVPGFLCFDHAMVLADYAAYRRTGKRRKT